MFLYALNYAGNIYIEAVLKTVPLHSFKLHRQLIVFVTYVLFANFCTNCICCPRYLHFLLMAQCAITQVANS